MRPDERDAAYLWDMLDAAKTAAEFTKDVSIQKFLQDRKLQFALERAIEIIGEAARRVSEPFKQSHPEIPWASMIGQRNVLIHEYGDVRLELVWKVATKNVPALIAQLESLIPSNPA